MHCFHRLLRLLEEEREIILNSHLDRLGPNLAVQHEVMEETHRWEKERIQVVQMLSNRPELRTGNVTLARLMEELDNCQSDELARMRETVLELNRKIHTASANNAFLICQSLHYTRRYLDILTVQPVHRGINDQPDIKHRLIPV